MGTNGVAEWLSAADDDEMQDANLRSSVLQRIRFGIVSGKISPGEILTVPTLAKAWGVSSTPVREALLELSNAGLIEPLRNRGFRVCMPSAGDLGDLFAIRVQLEVFAIELVQDMPPSEKASLLDFAQQIADAVESGDTIAYLAADRAFHFALVSLGNNPRLTSMIMDLRDNMRLYGIESEAGLERQVTSISEHFELVELVAARKLDDASSLLRRHILDWEPVFLAAIGGA
jgi:DNA-binding GntR family transcriptional regulator